MRRGPSKYCKNSEPMTPALKDAAESLRQIAKCLGYIVVNAGELKDKKDADKIPILHHLGFDRHQIAAVLRTTPETVSVRLSELGLTRRARKAVSGPEIDEKGRSRTPQ